MTKEMTQNTPGELWPCLTGEAIANLPEFKARRDELKSLISAPMTLYAALYENTVFRLMAFCQALPQNMAQPQAYSLLNTALDTTITALKRRRGKAMPHYSNSETIAEQEALWTYAVFTAGLWANWPDLQTDRVITLYRSEQELIGLWHPAAGCLYEPNTFYKILPKSHPVVIDRTSCLTSILGKILPSVAYRWLSSEPTVWSAWWEMITQTAGERNELKPLIQFIKDSSQSQPAASPESPAVVSSPEKTESAAEPLFVEATPEPESVAPESSPISVENSILEAASESSAVNEPMQQEEALSDLNEWIVKQASTDGADHCKKWFVRIQAGVLIRFSSLSKFIQEYPSYISPESLLKQLAFYLKKEDNQWIFRYHFVYAQIEEVVQGIILLRKGLCKVLKDFPDESQFIQGLSSSTNTTQEED